MEKNVKRGLWINSIYYFSKYYLLETSILSSSQASGLQAQIEVNQTEDLQSIQALKR